jgi:hypothetical protein
MKALREKIKKLKALAEGTSNHHEADLARERLREFEKRIPRPTVRERNPRPTVREPIGKINLWVTSTEYGKLAEKAKAARLSVAKLVSRIVREGLTL